MCQYSAEDGCMTDWHVIHLGHLALSGAALLTIEATAVTPEGRISYGDIGLWSDANEEAMARVLASVRRWSDMPIAIQLAHAGRKASTDKPWDGGAQIAPDDAERLADGRAVADPVPRRARTRRWRSTAPGSTASATRSPTPPARRAARPRRGPAARRARLPAAPVPLAALQPAHRRLWRHPREPHALPARGVRRGARRLPARASR